ncbi:MAG: hypothetical protein V2A73_08330 [Pseudomonadota bacterium]
MLRRRISVYAGLPPALAIVVGLGWVALGCDQSSPRQSASRGLVFTGEKMSVEPQSESPAAKACEGGDAIKCLELADQHSVAVAKDPTRASQMVALLGKTCELGLPLGCHRLAAAYQDGTDVAPDPGRAADLYERACAQGFAKSCVALGLTFRSGVGRTADAGQAARFYEKACDAGQLRGCALLGPLYRDGNGVLKDVRRGVGLMQKACDAGDPEACTSLGFMFDRGRGVKVDLPRAAALYTKACDMGESGGCNNLGALYHAGGGIPRDANRALAFYEKACRLGEQAACRNRDRLAQAQRRESAVDAKALWRSYDANEVAADSQYRGKRFLVRGIVQAITKDLADAIVVQLGSPNELLPTHAVLAKSDAMAGAAANLKRRQEVLLECTGGGMIVGSPILSECKLEM